MVHENAAHDSRGDGQEVRAVLPRHVVSGNQPQIRLVDERRRLQTVTDGLMTDVPPRDAMEFIVDERNQPFEGTVVALAPFEQQSGHFCGVRQGLILGPFGRPCRFFAGFTFSASRRGITPVWLR